MMNECFTVARLVGSTKSQCFLSVSHRQPPPHITDPASVVFNICGPGLIVGKVEKIWRDYGIYDGTRYWFGRYTPRGGISLSSVFSSTTAFLDHDGQTLLRLKPIDLTTDHGFR